MGGLNFKFLLEQGWFSVGANLNFLKRLLEHSKNSIAPTVGTAKFFEHVYFINL